MDERAQRMEALPMGHREEHTKTITQADVANFLTISGDLNPLYINEVAAKRAGERGMVVPSALLVGIVSAVMAKMTAHVPPPGGVSYRYALTALKPVLPGETVTASLEVIGKDVLRHEIYFNANCYTASGEKVMEGQTTLKVL
ncbi:MAG: MaoC family dehydratase N-terminal domain-containing protein [Clostridia bacterium]|nr:MaoC family dehydratase N-terminal domain-containing protein [Clostridia bacterium]